ncbi:hypothetical protein [Fimbriimonas ginsengisoli]|uniref:Uncharacterized protein n=1 Tax=Fimbriimonas ginsengisoli Gsoil 348 TaxID=661478 RepID=A0A068NM17_FIMGI|nr:hypothetical protein [Fimbriimonas ginsengisoli]AIE84462.1 hypothetical protein OP10G_1094 [Fimbriimonas ginsengisoli Gsoil 348]
MSLVLSIQRPAPLRGSALLALVLIGAFASALSLAPTLTRTASAVSDQKVCACVHCPGGTRCCCRNKGICPTGLH